MQIRVLLRRLLTISAIACSANAVAVNSQDEPHTSSQSCNSTTLPRFCGGANATTTAATTSTVTEPSTAGWAPWSPPDSMPGNDEWYRPAAGFESRAPGAILKNRTIPRGMSLNNKDSVNLKGAYQIQYRTTNSLGEADATVVTVLVPRNANATKLFAYSWMSDSTFQDCIPSLGLQVQTRTDNVYAQLQNRIVVAALAQGWYVSIADDGGILAKFGNGKYSGQSTLDSIRAVKQSSDITGVDKEPLVQLFGYSGSSIAAGWAAEMQPSYAPDVKLAGVALGGIVTNLTDYMVRGEELLEFSAYSGPLLVGVSKDFPAMVDWLQKNLLPSKAEEFRRLYSQCYDSNYDVYTNKSLGQYFKDGYRSITSELPVSYIKSVGTLGTVGIPKAPMYIFTSTGDELAPVRLTDELVGQYCHGGADIVYERTDDLKVNHEGEIYAAMPGVFRWVVDRFEGKSAPRGCVKLGESQESVAARRQRLWIVAGVSYALAWTGLPVGPSLWTKIIAQAPL